LKKKSSKGYWSLWEGYQLCSENYSIYLKLAWAYYEIQKFDSCIRYAKEAKNLINKKDFLKKNQELSRTYAILGICFDKKNEVDKALVYYEEARNLTSDELMKLALNVEITDLLISGKNNYEEAIPYLKEAMYISEKLNKNIENTWAIVILGYVYFKIKDFKNAKKYLTEGLKKSIKFNDKKLQALAHFYLGNLYFSEDKIQEAKYNFKKAYELYNSLGYKKTAKEIASFLKKLENIESFQDPYQSCLNKCDKTYEWALAICGIGSIPFSLKGYPEAYASCIKKLNKRENLVIKDALLDISFS